jgi:hypothetical protein
MALIKDFIFRHDAPTGRFILEYQALDEHGKDAGSKTHLEAATLSGLLQRSAESHAQAAAAFERMQVKLRNLEAKQEKQKQ